MASLMRKSGFQRGDLRPHAAGTLARLACTRAREAGIDVAPLMAKADVTRRQVEDDDIRLPVQSQIKFVELIADALKDDFLGFHLARDLDLREIGLLYYVFNSAELLGDAFKRAERYTTIVNEGISLHVREGKEMGVTFTYVGVERMLDWHQIEFWATSVVRACRQLTNRHLRPNCVRFLHRRSGGCTALGKFMGCDVVFDAGADRITFPGAIKDLPVVNADPYLNKLLVNYCEEKRSNQKSGRGTFRIGVENAIAPLLPHGRAQADEVAYRLGLSRRTLARRLASEGLTFKRVLSALRADLAKRYLRDEATAISQIAWLVGYKEVSAFTHAFTRWTGKTPREARAHEKLGLTESGRAD
jgi:AraC-like DNA-binding protein